MSAFHSRGGLTDRYNDHNTRAKLSLLTEAQINDILPEKEARKAVWNAVKGVTTGQVRGTTELRPQQTTDNRRQTSQVSVFRLRL